MAVAITPLWDADALFEQHLSSCTQWLNENGPDELEESDPDIHKMEPDLLAEAICDARALAAGGAPVPHISTWVGICSLIFPNNMQIQYRGRRAPCHKWMLFLCEGSPTFDLSNADHVARLVHLLRTRSF